jgi:hypothetical protein
MNSEDEDDNPKPERLPIYRKGKEILQVLAHSTKTPTMTYPSSDLKKILKNKIL